MQRSKYVGVVLLALALSACSVPFADRVAPEPVLTRALQRPDLAPAGLQPFQSSLIANELFNTLINRPTVTGSFEQTYQRQGDEQVRAGVNVLEFSTVETAQDMLPDVQAVITQHMANSVAQQVEAIGDVPAVQIAHDGMEADQLLFVRCNAVVHIRFNVAVGKNALVDYATLLDQQLQPIVCR